METHIFRGATNLLHPKDHALMLKNLNNSFAAIREDLLRLKLPDEMLQITISYEIKPAGAIQWVGETPDKAKTK